MHSFYKIFGLPLFIPRSKLKLFGFLLSCVFFTDPAFAQDHQVSGKVTQEDGDPIPGVSVLVKGASLGTTTDSEGNYQLIAPGNSTTALKYVNMVRNRAKNGDVVRFADGSPAANYVIEPYAAFPDQDYARKAVRFERRLELALEGQRWYDLVRWGIAEPVMNEYFTTEDRPLLDGKSYRSDFLPIPGGQIDITRDDDGNPTLIQNQAYR